MIGVGVYVSAGYALSDLRDAKYVLAVWFVAGIHAICGAIAYSAVARRLSVSGGEYAILTRWAHPSLGFVAGWVSLFAGFAAPIAISARLMADYSLPAGEAIANQETYAKLLATTVVIVAAGLHLIEIRWNAWVNNVVIFVKLIGLTLFLILGAKWILGGNGSTGVLTQPADAAPALSSLALFWGAIGSLYYTALSYTGFNASIYIAGEYSDLNEGRGDQREPLKRSFWKHPIAASMVFACVLVTAIYLMLNAVFLYAIPSEQFVAAGERFVGVVATEIGGPWFGSMMKWVIILSSATSVLAMMMTGPHVYAQLGRDLGLGRLVSNERTQVRLSIVVQTLITCAIIWVGTLKDTISYLGLTLTACGALAIASLWIAQGRQLFRDQPLRMGENIAAYVYVFGALALVVVSLGLAREQMKFVWCVATFALGVLVYFLFPRSPNSGTSGR
jgi:amino acid transporter